MKKQIIIAVILVALLAQMTSKLIVVSHFLINRAEIAEKYCENTIVLPMCDGACYLVKQINKTEKQEKNTTKHSKEQLLDNMSVCVIASIPTLKVSTPDIKVKANFPKIYCVSSRHSDAIFHPPLAA